MQIILDAPDPLDRRAGHPVKDEALTDPLPPVRGSTNQAAIGAVLDELRSVRLRIVAPLLLGFIMLFDSWDSVAISYVMTLLAREWQLAPAAIGWLLSAGYAGQFVGAIALGALAERYGRMPVFLIAMALMSLLALGCAIAPDYETLIALRFVQGFLIGGALPVSITYINEIAPTRIRGRYFATFQFICMSGYAVTSISSTYIIPNLGWRWLFGLGAFPLVLLPLVLMLLPESPRWLAREGRMGGANRALQKLGAQSVADLSVASREPAVASPSRPSDQSPRAMFMSLFGKELRVRTIIIIGLWFFTSFASFGLTSWVPSIYVTVFHIPVDQALRYSAIMASIFLFVAPSIALVIDIVGRRPLAIGGTAIAAAALLTLAFYQPDTPTMIAVLVIIGHASISGANVIVWPYTAENYPTRIRALGLGVASSTARGASMLTPVVVGTILGGGGSVSIVFGVFGCCALGAFVLWVTATRETAGKSLDDLG